MKAISIEYANYLMSFDWDAFYTQTFRNRRNDGHNSVNACWHYLENKLGWTKGFVAVESHRLGGVHLHCLLSNELADWSQGNPVRSQYIQTKSYMQKAFGWNHIESARNQATVSLYCAKYVCKDNGDYYFLGHWA